MQCEDGREKDKQKVRCDNYQTDEKEEKEERMGMRSIVNAYTRSSCCLKT